MTDITHYKVSQTGGFITIISQPAAEDPPGDSVVVTADEAVALLTSPAQLIVNVKAATVAAINDLLDAEALNLGYDSIQTAVSYADEPAVPQYQDEGQRLRAWRSLVWKSCFDVFDSWDIEAPQDPTVESITTQLPPLVITP